MKAMEQTKKKRRWWIIPLLLLLLLAIVGTTAILLDAPSRREVKSLSFGDVDFSNLRDGTYIGSFKGKQGSLRNATVEVTISAGAVSNLRVLIGAIGDDGAPAEIGNGQTVLDLFDSALLQRTLQVDVVSGATLTSKAHLKALEYALLQAQIQ